MRPKHLIRPSKEKQPKQSKQTVYEDSPCKSCELKSTPVPPEGSGKLMFIGMHPGWDEHKKGIPFCGISGDYLRTLLEKLGFKKEDLYFTNVVKCYVKGAPEVSLMKKCGRYLLQEIQEIQPKLIVLLGDLPLKYFFNKSKLSPYRGFVLPKGDYKFFVTFNPAHFFKNIPHEDERIFFERDMQAVYRLFYDVKVEEENVQKHLCKTLEEVNDELDALRHYVKKFALDIESWAPGKKKDKKSLDPWATGWICTTISFSYIKPDGTKYAFCVPVEHPESPIESDKVIHILSQFWKGFEDRGQQLVGQNIKWDLKCLQVHFGWDIYPIYFDTLPAHAFLIGSAPGKSHGLERMSIDYLNVDSWKIGNKIETDDVTPLELLSDMNMDDCIHTLDLAILFEQQLRDDDQWDYFQWISMPSLSTLKRIECNGMFIDQPLLFEIKKDLEVQIEVLTKKIFSYPELAGKDYLLTSARDMQEILFKKFKFNSKKKTKTGLCVDAEVIALLQDETQHPFLKDLTDLRSCNKNYTTYIMPYIERHIKYDGRVHPQFNQHIALTGRLSCDNPNLQNIPHATEIGAKVIKMFIVPPGHQMILADYNQMELRVMAAYSRDPKMLEAYLQGLDIHAITASTVFGIPYDDALKSKEWRVVAKYINFGIIYGITSQGLSKVIKRSEEESQVIINQYLETFHGVKEYMDKMKYDWHKTGYVKTLFGRKIRIPTNKDINRCERQAINSPIQGCLPGNTLVLTQEGYVPIVKAKGKVWTGTSWEKFDILNRGKCRLAEIEFSNGSKFVCDIRHEFLTVNDECYKFKSFKDISIGDKICTSFPQELEFGKSIDTEEFWYWMGYYFGDGHYGKIVLKNTLNYGQKRFHFNKDDITHENKKIHYVLEYYFGNPLSQSVLKRNTKQAALIKKIEKCEIFFRQRGLNVHKSTGKSGKLRLSITDFKFGCYLEKLGLIPNQNAHTKRIPDIVFKLDLLRRKAFLKGFMESNGWICGANLHLCQSEILRQVQLLCKTVGIISTLRIYDTSSFLQLNSGMMYKSLRIGEYRKIRASSYDAPKFMRKFKKYKYANSTSQYECKSLIQYSPEYWYERVKAIKILDREEITYTLSVKNSLHRFDSEGFISKNTASDINTYAATVMDEIIRKEKLNMIEIDIVHDSVLYEVPDFEMSFAPDFVKTVMENVELPFMGNIPLVVELSIGHSFGECKGV